MQHSNRRHRARDFAHRKPKWIARHRRQGPATVSEPTSTHRAAVARPDRPMVLEAVGGPFRARLFRFGSAVERIVVLPASASGRHQTFPMIGAIPQHAIGYYIAEHGTARWVQAA
jgi:hypothetical protein